MQKTNRCVCGHWSEVVLDMLGAEGENRVVIA
jgi:hypothetical protein